MTYTTPFTATPLAIITSAGWNTSARDDIEYLKGRAGIIAFESGATFAGNIVTNDGEMTLHRTDNNTRGMNITYTDANGVDGWVVGVPQSDTAYRFVDTYGGGGVAVRFNGAGGTIDFYREIIFHGAVVDSGYIHSDGVLFWTSTINAQSYITRSDERIKRDVAPAEPVDFSRVRSLSPVSYALRGEQHRDSPRLVGLIAQHLQEVIPWAVVEQEHAHIHGEPELGVSLPAMDTALLMYCQHLHDLHDSLDGRLAALEGAR